MWLCHLYSFLNFNNLTKLSQSWSFIIIFLKSQWYLAQYLLGPPGFTHRCKWFPGCLQVPTSKSWICLSSSAGFLQGQDFFWLPATVAWQSQRHLNQPQQWRMRVYTKCPRLLLSGGLFRGVLHLVLLTQRLTAETSSLIHLLLALPHTYPTFPSFFLTSQDHLSNKVCAPTFSNQTKATWCTLKNSNIPLFQKKVMILDFSIL